MTIDLLVMFAYLGVVTWLGFRLSTKGVTAQTYFKGDNGIPWWASAFSIFATLLSPISFMGLPGNSYAGTWLLYMAQLGIFLAIPLAIWLIVPTFSRYNIDTAYHYLEQRFGSIWLRRVTASIFVCYQLGRMALILYLPSLGLAKLTGTNPYLWISMMGIVSMVYAYQGGLKSVIWTDVVQGVLLLLGVGLTLLTIGRDLGWTFIKTNVTANRFFSQEDLSSGLMLLIFLGAGINTFSSYLSSQDIVQRLTVTKDKVRLTGMFLTNGFLSLLMATGLYLVGTGLSLVLPKGLPQDQVFMTYIGAQIPFGLRGLLLAAVVAAAQSTLSTGLNAVSASINLDIRRKALETIEIKDARHLTIMLGILVMGVAVLFVRANILSAYEWFIAFMGTILGVLAGVFLLGITNSRAGSLSAWFALSVSILVSLYVRYGTSVSSWLYGLISIIVALSVGGLVSLWEKR